MVRFFTLDEVRRRLRAEIAKAGSQTEWARRNRVDRSSVCSFLTGRRPPEPRILQALGLEKVSVYAPIEKAKASRRTAARS